MASTEGRIRITAPLMIRVGSVTDGIDFVVNISSIVRIVLVGFVVVVMVLALVLVVVSAGQRG